MTSLTTISGPFILKQYSLDRQGTVDWQVFGPNHCGTVNHLHGGSIRVRYDVSLKCENQLDSQGFLIDNMFVDNLMRELAAVPTDLSCELLVDHIATHLFAAIEKVHGTLLIRSCRISLSPDPFEATITGEYSH
jgi:hypothetical protein